MRGDLHALRLSIRKVTALTPHRQLNASGTDWRGKVIYLFSAAGAPISLAARITNNPRIIITRISTPYFSTSPEVSLPLVSMRRRLSFRDRYAI